MKYEFTQTEKEFLAHAFTSHLLKIWDESNRLLDDKARYNSIADESSKIHRFIRENDIVMPEEIERGF